MPDVCKEVAALTVINVFFVTANFRMAIAAISRLTARNAQARICAAGVIRNLLFSGKIRWINKESRKKAA